MNKPFKQYLKTLDNTIFLLKEYADEIDKSNTNDVDGSQLECLMSIKSNLKRLAELYYELDSYVEIDDDEVEINHQIDQAKEDELGW